MSNGISVYVGLNCSIDENIILIESAAALGLNRLFTSSIIPESDNQSEEFAIVLAAAIENNFEIIMDVTPETITAFDFEQIILRLDDGFKPLQIAALSHIRRIMLNASTVNERTLNELANLGANFENISALHNFYPHIFSGLDVSYFKSQNDLLHKFEIEVGAFIPTLEGIRRLPFCEGLTTLETTRNASVDYSARYLTALNTDFVLIADSMPTPEECISLASISSDKVIFDVNLLTADEVSKELLTKNFYSRPEISRDVIRAANSRQILTQPIQPDNDPKPRQLGDVTIDNSDFGRYAGEVQIVKSSLPADPRVNIVAQIVPSDLLFLNSLNTSKNFSFRFV